MFILYEIRNQYLIWGFQGNLTKILFGWWHYHCFINQLVCQHTQEMFHRSIKYSLLLNLMFNLFNYNLLLQIPGGLFHPVFLGLFPRPMTV